MPAVTVVLMTLALAGISPAAAAANSLLSGYGGPGQGSQAILGSALLGGPSGGGGSGGGGSTAGTGTAEGATSGSQGAAGGSARGSSRAAGRGNGRAVERAAAPSGSAAKTHGPAASSATTARAPVLELPAADLVYALLALVALALTGVLTRQLARRSG